MNSMLQMTADQLGVPVERPVNQQTTVMGAAYLAGIAEGFWSSSDAVSDAWELEQAFSPTETDRTTGYANWKRASAAPLTGGSAGRCAALLPSCRQLS